jgi:hypothetical protein
MYKTNNDLVMGIYGCDIWFIKKQKSYMSSQKGLICCSVWFVNRSKSSIPSSTLQLYRTKRIHVAFDDLKESHKMFQNCLRKCMSPISCNFSGEKFLLFGNGYSVAYNSSMMFRVTAGFCFPH